MRSSMLWAHPSKFACSTVESNRVSLAGKLAGDKSVEDTWKSTDDEIPGVTSSVSCSNVSRLLMVCVQIATTTFNITKRKNWKLCSATHDKQIVTKHSPMNPRGPFGKNIQEMFHFWGENTLTYLDWMWWYRYMMYKKRKRCWSFSLFVYILVAKSSINLYMKLKTSYSTNKI